ncbi:MAG: phosphoribosylglycinamide formyltransferase [Bacteroidetes bacterium]|nr:phosphoribosylglycinamide formyltransferase [Bacteroidota bacterium]
MKNIVIFASGSGSNAENIANYFKHHSEIKISAIFTNNKEAGVIVRAKKLEIPCYIYSNKQFAEADEIIVKLKELNTDAIILAGFLRLITKKYLDVYPNKIVNVHPALLPNYGGKGMYGMHVHEAVIANKEEKSGITIHLANEHFDEGTILYQATCDLDSFDTTETLAHKIHQLEFVYFPRVIEQWLKEK